MTFNLLFWKWSEEFDTPAKRKKSGIKFGSIAAQFVISGDHPAIGNGDIASFRAALDVEFGGDQDNRPFVVEDYGKCAVINYPNAVRFELVPKVAGIGKRFGLNSAEF
ncbi:hypothetical protein GGC65_001821 [Sphingopyxis sp. OAS728]|uniref:hypothetical protein n=1 Tax=Sphingopyxis sp. OAS728 TaxID=2663823 RepID=UPI0017896AAE|nr:hypothetical protein [Sphingopyxis sp. OAS728]MBE1527365.1 hypothetical protein [Sphingopyxis sp. OAS728]